jgi:hypothetical protein
MPHLMHSGQQRLYYDHPGFDIRDMTSLPVGCLVLSSRLPMGNLTVVINYGDGSNASIYLGEDLSILLADGLKLNHSYIEQRNYVYGW